MPVGLPGATGINVIIAVNTIATSPKGGCVFFELVCLFVSMYVCPPLEYTYNVMNVFP